MNQGARVDGERRPTGQDLPQPATELDSAPDENERIRAWLVANGYLRDETLLDRYGIAWSHRSGYDFTDLEFDRWHNERYPTRWEAIVGHHASGTNPRMSLGCCESLADVQTVHEALRRINGYPTGPSPDEARPPAHDSRPGVPEQ